MSTNTQPLHTMKIDTESSLTIFRSMRAILNIQGNTRQLWLIARFTRATLQGLPAVDGKLHHHWLFSGPVGFLP